MAEVVTESIVTAERMRDAIRDRLRAGATREAIYWMVCAFAPNCLWPLRFEGNVPRVPVEAIQLERREAFLAALSDLRGVPML